MGNTNNILNETFKKHLGLFQARIRSLNEASTNLPANHPDMQAVKGLSKKLKGAHGPVMAHGQPVENGEFTKSQFEVEYGKNYSGVYDFEIPSGVYEDGVPEPIAVVFSNGRIRHVRVGGGGHSEDLPPEDVAMIDKQFNHHGSSLANCIYAVVHVPNDIPARLAARKKIRTANELPGPLPSPEDFGDDAENL